MNSWEEELYILLDLSRMSLVGKIVQYMQDSAYHGASWLLNLWAPNVVSQWWIREVPVGNGMM